MHPGSWHYAISLALNHFPRLYILKYIIHQSGMFSMFLLGTMILFAEYTGVRAHVTERNIRTRFIKPVHHMEVSLRTQQMLQHFIEEDRVQKQEMMNELNMLRNIVVNNGNIGREGLRRHLKGLCKLNFVGQL